MRNPKRKSSNANVKTISIDQVLETVDKASIKETNIEDLNQSPLLNSPIVEKGYTSRTEVENAQTAQEPVHKADNPIGQILQSK